MVKIWELFQFYAIEVESNIYFNNLTWWRSLRCKVWFSSIWQDFQMVYYGISMTTVSLVLLLSVIPDNNTSIINQIWIKLGQCFFFLRTTNIRHHDNWWFDSKFYNVAHSFFLIWTFYCGGFFYSCFLTNLNTCCSRSNILIFSKQ